MKELIKKFLNYIIKLILNLFNTFNIGRYILDKINSNIYKVSIPVKNEKVNLKFYSPNRLNYFRINTFFSKEPETLGWIDQFESDSVFFDVGANIGLYSCYAAKKKNCKVFSFEPSVFNLDLLAKNIHLNSLSKKIVIVPNPLTNINKISEFNMSTIEAGGALSTFGETYTHDGTEIEKSFNYNVPGTTLDETISFFKLPQPKYLKIDVDGIEHLIIEGADQTLNSVQSILVEVNDKFKLQNDKINKKLTEKGFEMREKKQSELLSKTEQVKDVFNQIWYKK